MSSPESRLLLSLQVSESRENDNVDKGEHPFGAKNSKEIQREDHEWRSSHKHKPGNQRESESERELSTVCNRISLQSSFKFEAEHFYWHFIFSSLRFSFSTVADALSPASSYLG